MKSRVVFGENQFLEVAKEKINWNGISKSYEERMWKQWV